jgi:3'-5' exoribonuclease
MVPFDLLRATVGDRVQHEFLVLERQERRQANGDPFVVLTLGNASGRITTAPVWANQLDWVAGAEKGRVVQIIGDVTSYRSRRQLRLSAALRVLPSESVQPELFLPRIGVATEQLWDWVDRARGDLKSAPLRRAVDLFFADDAFRVEFELAPASVEGHHAAVGGLLLHVTEVATIARNSARVIKANTDLVVVGALLHDIGKVQSLAITPTGFEETAAGRLLGHPVLGVLMLHERIATAAMDEVSSSQRLELQHMILAQRGAAKVVASVEPLTVEAEILRLADQTSSSASGMAEALADEAHIGDSELIDAQVGSMVRKLWRRPHSWE